MPRISIKPEYDSDNSEPREVHFTPSTCGTQVSIDVDSRRLNFKTEDLRDVVDLTERRRTRDE